MFSCFLCCGGVLHARSLLLITRENPGCTAKNEVCWFFLLGPCRRVSGSPAPAVPNRGWECISRRSHYTKRRSTAWCCAAGTAGACRALLRTRSSHPRCRPRRCGLRRTQSPHWQSPSRSCPGARRCRRPAHRTQGCASGPPSARRADVPTPQPNAYGHAAPGQRARVWHTPLIPRRPGHGIHGAAANARV